LVARGVEIRETGERLEASLGTGMIGPTKIGYAWDSGIRGYDAITSASYEQLAEVTGFGPHLAAHLVEHFGGRTPPRKVRISTPPGSGVPPPTTKPERGPDTSAERDRAANASAVSATHLPPSVPPIDAGAGPGVGDP